MMSLKCSLEATSEPPFQHSMFSEAIELQSWWVACKEEWKMPSKMKQHLEEHDCLNAVRVEANGEFLSHKQRRNHTRPHCLRMMIVTVAGNQVWQLTCGK